MTDQINLTGPITVTLSPAQVQMVLAGLNELPYKFAQPIVDHIVAACRAATQPTP